MKTNKEAREELKRIYGNESMFQKSGAEQYIEGLQRITTYKKFLEKKKFKGKKIEKQLQFHHLKHRAEGGKATTENGALVYGTEHVYIHSLPRQQEEIINNHIRQWKVDFMTFANNKVIDSAEITAEDCRDDTEFIEIPVYTTKVDLKQLEERRRRKEKRDYQKLRKEMEDR